MEDEILNLFAHNDLLSFNEIQKSLKIRSNNLAYHIKKLLAANKIEKQAEKYNLSPNSEYLIPYMSTKTSVIPVILIKIGKSGRFFLIKRNKRPYKGLLGLPGGRLLVGETIEEAAKRIMKEKCSIEIASPKIEKVALEQVKKENKIIHSFILILVSAQAKSPTNLTSIEKNKSKIIKSDYHLIKSKSNPKSLIQNIYSKE